MSYNTFMTNQSCDKVSSQVIYSGKKLEEKQKPKKLRNVLLAPIDICRIENHIRKVREIIGKTPCKSSSPKKKSSSVEGFRSRKSSRMELLKYWSSWSSIIKRKNEPKLETSALLDNGSEAKPS